MELQGCLMEQCTVRLSLGQGFDGTCSAEDTVLYFLCKAQNSLLEHRITRLGGYLTSPAISMRALTCLTTTGNVYIS